MCHASTTPVSSTTIVPRPTELGQWNGDAVDPATWLPLQLQVTTVTTLGFWRWTMEMEMSYMPGELRQLLVTTVVGLLASVMENGEGVL
jgi:hypothetical protein